MHANSTRVRSLVLALGSERNEGGGREKKRSVADMRQRRCSIIKTTSPRAESLFCPRGRHHHFIQAPPPRSPPSGPISPPARPHIHPGGAVFFTARNSWAWRQERNLIGGRDLIGAAVGGACESACRHFLIFFPPYGFFTKRDGLPATGADVQTRRVIWFPPGVCTVLQETVSFISHVGKSLWKSHSNSQISLFSLPGKYPRSIYT